MDNETILLVAVVVLGFVAYGIGWMRGYHDAMKRASDMIDETLGDTK